MVLFKNIKVPLFLILICFYPLSASSEDKVVLTSHNLFPYGSFSETEKIKNIADDNYRGVAVDVVTCVFAEMGTPLEIKILPWKRAQLMVQSGKADGFFAASQKDQRDEFAVMSDIIAEQEWRWYLLKENSISPTDSDFKAKATVGGFLGANMLKWMEENKYNVAATPQNTEGLLDMLIAKRIDAVMANNYVMEALLAKHDLGNNIKSYLVKNKPLGVYFSKAFLKLRPGFLKEFNSFIPDCRECQ